MAGDHTLFKSKEQKKRHEAADLLYRFADKVSEGKLQLKQGQEEVSLDLPENVILEVTVEDKKKGKSGTRHKLELEIMWYDGDDERGPMELS